FDKLKTFPLQNLFLMHVKSLHRDLSPLPYKTPHSYLYPPNYLIFLYTHYILDPYIFLFIYYQNIYLNNIYITIIDTNTAMTFPELLLIPILSFNDLSCFPKSASSFIGSVLPVFLPFIFSTSLL